MLSYRFPWVYELSFKFPPGLIFRRKSLNSLIKELQKTKAVRKLQIEDEQPRGLPLHPTSYPQHIAKKFKRILDVGCGAGVLTPILRKLYPSSEVLGIDSSADMISFAKKRYGELAEFRVVDFFDYQGKHDLIIGFYSFEFFPLAKGIEKIKELLEPGGMCIIVTTGRAPFSIIHQFFVAKFLRTEIYLYSPSDFYSLLRGTKFSLSSKVISEFEGSYFLTLTSF